MTGKTVLNGFPDPVGNGPSYGFMNSFKLIQTVNYPDPGAINADGLPKDTASLPAAITWSSWFLPAAYGTGTWVLSWSGTGSTKLVFANAVTVDTQSGTGLSVSGTGTTNLTVTGANVRLTMHFAAGTPFSNSGQFNASQAYSGFSNLVFCKLADEPNVATAIFNPDFIALLNEVNPRVLRLMDWSFVNNSLVSQHAYRAPTTAFSYTALRYQPEAWAGTASLTGLAYSCSAPSTWPGLVDGATVQLTASPVTLLVVTGTVSGTGAVCRISVTGDTTGLISENQWVYFGSTSGAGNNAGGFKAHIVSTGATSVIELIGSTYSSNEVGYLSYATLQVGASASKLIIGTFFIRSSAQAVFNSSPGGNAGLMTFVYSSIADAFLVSGGGMQTGVPVEMQVALCNKVGCDYWSTIHLSYTNAAISSHVTYIRDNLVGTAHFELSNEVWNPGFGQATTAPVLGKYLGFALGNGRQYLGYLGMRFRQIMETAKSLYSAAGKTNYKGVLAFQSVASSASVRDYLVNGGDLVAGLTSPVTGTTTLDSFVTAFAGAPASYNSSPNRPGDLANYLSYAHYYQGAQCTWPSSVYANTMTSGGPVGNTVGLLGAADQYALGDAANVTLALNWLDWDFRQGTINGSVANPDQSLFGLSSVYTTWDGLISTNWGTSARASISMPPLKVLPYEGGLQATLPTTATLSSLGFSSGDQTKYGGSGGSINTLLAAYKNDNRLTFLVKSQIDAFMSKSTSEAPVWFNLLGPNDWSLLNGGTYSRATGTPAWKSFDEVKLYNNGKRRIVVKT